MTIDWVVFDLGDVVCRFRPERRLDALSALTGLSVARIEQRWWGAGLEEAAERGELVAPAVFDGLRRALRVDVSDDQLRRLWSLAFEPDPEVLALVRMVRGRTALFTNNGPVVTACLEHELREAGEAFDQLVFSWQLGYRKPEPEAFEALVLQLDGRPGTTLFIDDRDDNVASARAVGLDAIAFTSVADLEQQLRARQVLD